MRYFLRTALSLLAVSSVTCSAVAQETVRVAPFDSVELEGGGHVVVKYGAVQSVRLINGSTRYTRFVSDEPHKLKIDACDRECPRDYDLEVEIVTPRLAGLGISGGGAIDCVGSFPGTDRLGLGVDGGGSIDTRAVDARSASAAVNGGGNIKLRATSSLTAAIDGGGRIRYWGNPQVTQAIDGGGSIGRGN